ncbi:MAG: SRPBCC family protein [Actinomycetota bacterium]|nr:SRPBCC family protein [Actinomycetota bacterium]
MTTDQAAPTRVEVSRSIASDPGTLYDLVSDVTNMGRWSPETTSCTWVKGATGPAVGARFRGANRARWRRWSTTCTVVAAEPGREFGFEVTLGPIPIARWTYQFEAEGDGTRVTEVWDDLRAKVLKKPSAVIMSVPDRAGHNRAGMEATLDALKQQVEQTP